MTEVEGGSIERLNWKLDEVSVYKGERRTPSLMRSIESVAFVCGECGESLLAFRSRTGSPGTFAQAPGNGTIRIQCACRNVLKFKPGEIPER